MTPEQRRARQIVAGVMGHVSGGDNRMSDSEFQARTDAVCLHYGVPLKNPHRDANMFRSLDLFDHGRDLLAAAGVRSGTGSSADVWQKSIEIHRSALGTADLPALIENIATRSVMAGWDNAPVSYPRWCRNGTLANYRQESRVGLSSYPALPEVPEGGPITVANRSSRNEHIQGAKYASIFRVSRQVILGDEVGALTREPQAYGRAARVTVQKAVTTLLTRSSGAGPTMNQDSTALFHADHGNLVSVSGTAPTVAALDAARKAMRTRTDPTSGEVLNVVPRVLLVPAGLETTARVVVASNNTPLGDAEGDLIVAVDPHLDAVSATAWYLLADGAVFDTFEVGFLSGATEPAVETRQSWTTDGSEIKVSLSFGVAALDFRGMYRNVGA